MEANEAKSVRSDLILLGCAAALLLGSCIAGTILIRGLFVRPPEAPGDGGPAAGEATGKELRIPVPGPFSDATAIGATRETDVTSGEVRFGVSGDGGIDMAFLRFPIDLPPDVEIASAWIEFRSSEGAVGSWKDRGRNRIYLLDRADQPKFAKRFWKYDDLLNAPVLGTYIQWDTGRWKSGETYRTHNIAPLIRAYLDRDDYAPGNHIGFKITPRPPRPGDAPNLLRADSHEGGHPPVLIIKGAQ